MFYQLPTEPYTHLKLLGDLFKCQNCKNIFKKCISLKNVRDCFALVANLVADVLVNKYVAV